MFNSLNAKTVFAKTIIRKPDHTELCTRVWPAMLNDVFTENHYTRLSSHASREINGAWRNENTGFPGLADVDKMRNIMDCIIASPDKAIDDVANDPLFSKDENNRMRGCEIVAIAASLITMMKIRTEVLPEKEPATLWTTGTHVSLRQVTEKAFQISSQGVLQGTIDQKFTLSYLAVYYNCSIAWTDRLDRHLEIEVTGRTNTVMVYQHKIWLAAHSKQEDDSCCILPQRILCEALDTLNLLFPHNDRCTKSFLTKQGQLFHTLGYCGRERKLELENYPYWGCKIKRLLDIFEGKRSGIWQFLPDSKGFNLIESANFWIATAAAFLAFVGFVLGLTSIVYAKWSYDVGVRSMAISEESLELTRLQYQLSLAQACTDPNEARLLPDFCSAEE